MFQVALLILKNNCAVLIINPCRNVGVVARTSSIYDHFIIWPSNVTLTFNLPEQMFQMTLLLLEENNCAFILKSMHNLDGRYGPDKLNLWPFYHLTFKSDVGLHPTWTNVSNGKNYAKLFWNPCINVEVMARTRSIYYHFIIGLQLTLTVNLPEQMFQKALLLMENNCAKLFWNPYM